MCERVCVCERVCERVCVSVCESMCGSMCESMCERVIGPNFSLLDINLLKEKCTMYTSKDEVYKTFRQMGLEYGPNFQGT